MFGWFQPLFLLMYSGLCGLSRFAPHIRLNFFSLPMFPGKVRDYSFEVLRRIGRRLFAPRHNDSPDDAGPSESKCDTTEANECKETTEMSKSYVNVKEAEEIGLDGENDKHQLDEGVNGCRKLELSKTDATQSETGPIKDSGQNLEMVVVTALVSEQEPEMDIEEPITGDKELKASTPVEAALDKVSLTGNKLEIESLEDGLEVASSERSKQVLVEPSTRDVYAFITDAEPQRLITRVTGMDEKYPGNVKVDDDSLEAQPTHTVFDVEEGKKSINEELEEDVDKIVHSEFENEEFVKIEASGSQRESEEKTENSVSDEYVKAEVLSSSIAKHASQPSEQKCPGFVQCSTIIDPADEISGTKSVLSGEMERATGKEAFEKPEIDLRNDGLSKSQSVSDLKIEAEHIADAETVETMHVKETEKQDALSTEANKSVVVGSNGMDQPEGHEQGFVEGVGLDQVDTARRIDDSAKEQGVSDEVQLKVLELELSFENIENSIESFEPEVSEEEPTTDEATSKDTSKSGAFECSKLTECGSTVFQPWAEAREPDHQSETKNSAAKVDTDKEHPKIDEGLFSEEVHEETQKEIPLNVAVENVKMQVIGLIDDDEVDSFEPEASQEDSESADELNQRESEKDSETIASQEPNRGDGKVVEGTTMDKSNITLEEEESESAPAIGKEFPDFHEGAESDKMEEKQSEHENEVEKEQQEENKSVKVPTDEHRAEEQPKLEAFLEAILDDSKEFIEETSNNEANISEAGQGEEPKIVMKNDGCDEVQQEATADRPEGEQAERGGEAVEVQAQACQEAKRLNNEFNRPKTGEEPERTVFQDTFAHDEGTPKIEANNSKLEEEPEATKTEEKFAEAQRTDKAYQPGERQNEQEDKTYEEEDEVNDETEELIDELNLLKSEKGSNETNSLGASLSDEGVINGETSISEAKHSGAVHGEESEPTQRADGFATARQEMDQSKEERRESESDEGSGGR